MPKDPSQHPEENFLARWSRRKTKTAERAEVAEPPPGGALGKQQRDDAAQSVQVAQPAEGTLTDEQMPPIDSLTEDSDFSGFLSPGVSEGLRKLALRKLFRSATFNIRDGLDDYDDDFRNFAALGDLITSDMKHQMELAEERKRREQATEQQPESEPREDAAPDETEADTANPPPPDQASDDEPSDTTQDTKHPAGGGA